MRRLLQLVGKSEGKVIAVFGVSPKSCDRAVRHVRQGVPEVPIWLFASCTPLEETASLCERTYAGRNSLALLLRAAGALWPRQVALAVGTWTERPGGGWVKLAPFLVPPFRTLLLNSHGDFFSGSAGAILLHIRRCWADRSARQWQAGREWLAGGRRWARKRRRALGQAGREWLASGRRWARERRRALAQRLRAIALLALSAALRKCGYPYRRWFGNLHGHDRLDAFAHPTEGAGVLRFGYREPGWSAEGLRRAVAASHARWVLWTDGEDPQPIGDLLALFGDKRTFAVSRQCDFRGWKPGLMPTAAFRQLQPGEASQVLAPLGRTIVADRRKLADLGIPDSALAQTAWLLLFWKAAAAGWRSYSVGGTAMLAQQPDFPCSETEFFWHFLTRPEMRRLGPAEEDLAQGAIAFRPVTRRASGVERDSRASRLRVLLVSPFLPLPLSHGGAVRIYNLCRALAGRVDFILLAIREKQDEVLYQELEEVFREVRVVDIDQPPSQNQDEPQQVRQCQSRSLRAAIRELARVYHPDLLQIEYTHLADYRAENLGIPAILVEHDLTWTLYRQIAERDGSAESRREFEAWQRFEQRHLRAFDAVWTVSEEDRQTAISEGSKAERTFAIPNGVDLKRFRPDGAEPEPAYPEVLFVGSFRHLPNVLGCGQLLDEVMPRVWQQLPEVRVRVVGGPRHDYYWEQFLRNSLAGGAHGRGPAPGRPLDGRIEMHGFLEDLRPVYARATVVVAPLPVSAGTNIKVLEAMACGKAVVTTPVGCAGLGLRAGHDALVCPGWQEFAAALCELLRDPGLRGRLARQGRHTVEERFGWDTIAERAYQAYTAILSGAPWESTSESVAEPLSKAG